MRSAELTPEEMRLMKEPARGPLGGSGASDAYAEPPVLESRRLEALKAAATACAGDTALSEQQIVTVAKVFEAYLKGGATND